MSDRACVRGCTTRGVHFATCADYGKEVGATCQGCAPEPARDGALICDRCFRRIRRHLDNAPDLVGRLRSLSDPMAAAVYDRVRVSGGGTEAPAPTPPDLIDASDDVMRTLRSWAVYVDPRSGILGGMPAGAGALAAYDYARHCANVILGDFDRLANRRDEILQLGDAVLTRHPADAEGIRSFWSIVDTVSRYRLERPDAAVLVDAQDDEDREVVVGGIEEWRDRLITRAEAEREQYAASGATLRRWVAKELIVPRAVTYGPMGKVTWFRESELLALRAEMDARVGRPRKARP
ncbi:hypothetical protein [Microbacterium aurantiacum]|uniref:Uncharacterized protein n=1 Tax=Microbacterium aurantiacum TaxID=162393 RepID=A0ABT8FRG1_9MICO|nr:hypothetical protein [Microbacterium aurantiacum]MDN4463908.1 hypothetical protein [Microbacterium aurantiacum]